jgi:hypothetical protein
MNRNASTPLVSSPPPASSAALQVLQQSYPSVSLKDLPILERFLEYATSAIEGDDRKFTVEAGLPVAAMTFAALGHFFDDAELISVLEPDAQSQLIDEIRPPPGRLVTWTDFTTILQIVADAVHPTIPNEALALELVCRRALEKLCALDDASKMKSIGSAQHHQSRSTQDSFHSAAPLPQQSRASLPNSTLSQSREVSKSPDSQIRTVDRHMQPSEPRKRRGGAAAPSDLETPLADRSSCSYRPLCLSELTTCVNAFLDEARRKALRALPPTVPPSHVNLYRSITQEMINKLAPVAPRPCKVKALKISFQNDDDTAVQLVDALSGVTNAVPITGGAVDADSTQSNDGGVTAEVLWQVIRACGAVLFSNSPNVAQEELSLQVFLRAFSTTR